MRFQHVAEHIFNKPWLITPSAHDAIVRLFNSKCANIGTFADDGGQDFSALVVQREPASLDVNGIGHVHIKGVVGQGLSKIEKSCGNTDTRDVQNELDALLSQGAKGILITIDSPGGTVTGVPELAEKVTEVALEIPVVVFCDSQMCSAAYWIGSAGSKIVATESAELGSIGVYIPWYDVSAKMEKEGIESTPIINTGGTYKGIHLFASLSDAHRAQLQASVDRIFALFRDAVVTSRGMNEAIVPDTALQGQCFLGIDALENGLADAIGSKDDAYELLLMEIDIDEQPESEPEESETAPTQDASTVEETAS